MQDVRTGEIVVAAIHEIDRAGFGNQKIKRRNIVPLTVVNRDETWDVAA
jgi:hypothetical protein